MALLKGAVDNTDGDMYAAMSMWVDRIAGDLAAIECRSYPEAAR